MLPDEVYFREGHGLFWKARTRPDMRQNVAVLDTELLHLASLVEAGLTDEQRTEYSGLLLRKLVDDFLFLSATWQQRVTALASVKGVTL
jgi:hypothetical protein